MQHVITDVQYKTDIRDRYCRNFGANRHIPKILTEDATKNYFYPSLSSL